MPIKMDGKSFEDFDAAVAHVKKTKPSISSPEGYVATVERAEKDSKLERVASLIIKRKEDKRRADLANPTFKKAGMDKKNLANPKFKKITPSDMGTTKIAGSSDEGKKKLANPTFPAIKKSDILPHPFNKMASLHKHQILSRIKGAQYKPIFRDPSYENLDLESRQGIDNMFNKERINIIYAKLAKMSFSGSSDADIKKTGADVEKEKEKIPKGITDPFNYLGAKIREAIMSDFTYNKVNMDENREGDKGEKKNKQLGAPVKVTEPKKDPQDFTGGLSAKEDITDEEREATEYYGQIPENVPKSYRQKLVERFNSE